MGLGYFPSVYTDEALYSVLARYYVHTGTPGVSRSNYELFGKSSVRSTFDLPNFAHRLVKKFDWPGHLTLEEVHDRLTHINYYTAFIPESMAFSIRKMLVEGHPNLHLALGLNSSIVSRKDCLSYCLSCTREMMRDHGEMYWRLDHQLPGVLVCLKHKEVLRRSSVSLWSAGAHGFVAATKDTCPSHGPRLVPKPSAFLLDQFCEIARRSKLLLKRGLTFESFEAVTQHYRDQLWQKGLMISRHQLNVPKFTSQFEELSRRLLEGLEPVFTRQTSGFAWPLEMARKQTSIKHPLQHILFQMFLDNLEPRETPFGLGPWPCRNVWLHRTLKNDLVSSVREKRNSAGVTGTFECGCGFVYTMSRLNDGRLAGPRYKQFGPSLDPAIRELVDQGETLRGSAKKLGIHPRAVAQAAHRLGLNTGWKAKESAGPRLGQASHPPPKSRARLPRPRKSRPSSPRIDWRARDVEMFSKIRAAVADIANQKPLVRISRIAIERHVKGPNYFWLRKHNLPKSFALATALAETTDEFRERRLQFALRILASTGIPFGPSKVMRAAGLPTSWKPRVSSLCEVWSPIEPAPAGISAE